MPRLLGESHPTTVAFEKPQTELVFENTKLLAQRRRQRCQREGPQNWLPEEGLHMFPYLHAGGQTLGTFGLTLSRQRCADK
jgi:hypothetical protein